MLYLNFAKNIELNIKHSYNKIIIIMGIGEFSRPDYWSGLTFSFSRGSFQPRDRTQVSHIPGGFFTSWASREAQNSGFILAKINKGGLHEK